jgi:hypothetical protein
MANNIRVQPLHEAKAAYDQAIAAFREAQAHVVASADAQWATFYAATDEWLREEGLRCEIEADEAIRAAQRALQNAKSLAPARVKEALDAAEDELRPYVEQAHSQWHEIAIWRRWVWPTQNDLLVYNRYRHLRRDFALWQAARRKFERRQRQRRASVEDALDLMLVAKCARNAAINYTKRCGIARVSAVAAIEKVRQAATTGIAAARATAVKKLQTQQ